MFCGKCGTQIPEEAISCPNCGAEITPVVATVDASKKTAPNFDAKKLKPLLIGVAAIVVVIIGIVAFSNRTPTIDLSKYVVVEFTGYDGYGIATCYISDEQIKADYKGKIKFTDSAKQRYTYLNDLLESDNEPDPTSYFAEYSLFGDLDNDTDLSNGDTITFSWHVTQEELAEEFKIKANTDDIVYTVSGLKEATKFDAFEGVDVVFSGVSSEGRAEIDTSGSPYSSYDFNYTLEQSSWLSNGDTVTVTFDHIPSTFAAIYEMIPEELTKTYTVSGLSDYLTTADDISDEAWEQMKQQAEDELEQWHAQSSSATLISSEYLGYYFRTPKSSDSYNKNRVTLVYQVTSNYNSSYYEVNENQTYYWDVSFENLMDEGDGQTYVDVTKASTCDDRTQFSSPYTGYFGNTYTHTYSFYGHKNLYDLRTAEVSEYKANYNFEENVTDTVTETEATTEVESTSETESANDTETNESESTATETMDESQEETTS